MPRLAVANISKAAVNGYLGREIPDWQALGLDPSREYQLLRPATSSQEQPQPSTICRYFRSNVPVDVSDHRPDLVVGSSATDARFVAPYLQNSLVIWTAGAIAGVVSGKQRELSSAYRYRAVMEGGTYDGVRHDGRMVEIIGNHVALVAEGRAGSDVVVGDAGLRRRGYSEADERDYARRWPNAARIKISL
jgi:hypothetical protein